VSRVGVAVGGLTVAVALVAGGIMVGQRGVTPPAADPRPAAVVTTAATPPAAHVHAAGPLHSVVTVDPSAFDPPPTHTPIGLIAWTILALIGGGVATMLWRMWLRDRAADRAEPASTFVGWMAPARNDIGPITHELPAGGGAFVAPQAAGRMPAWVLPTGPGNGPRRPTAATTPGSTTTTTDLSGGYHRTR